MRFKRSSGFTLIELIVSVAMLGTLLLFLSPLLGGALGGKTPRELLRKAEVASDSQQLIQRLRFYFSRARDGAFTQGPAVLFLGVNLASSALVVRSDMRPCTTFNPSSSATNLNRIEIFSSAPNNRPLTANLPQGGTRVLTSACGADWGLSIREFNPGGGQISATCNRFITNFNGAVIGNSKLTGSVIFNLDFAAQTETSWNGQQMMGQNPVFFNLTSSYGNSINAPMVACSQTGDFH